jgi:hypothetical protein
MTQFSTMVLLGSHPEIHQSETLLARALLIGSLLRFKVLLEQLVQREILVKLVQPEPLELLALKAILAILVLLVHRGYRVSRA